MNVAPAQSRRTTARELTRVANASVAQILAMARSPREICRRVGITGPPGAGKSSLISRLTEVRLSAHPGNIAILAIDPTSPVSGGALLGDRVRMDAISHHPRVYIRSLASRSSVDGLADNLSDLAEVFERAGFAELVIETVGVGQVGYEVRRMVDSVVLVLIPGAGDRIQAMKSGILEVADILVVNTADLAGARQLAIDLEDVCANSRRPAEQWMPSVVSTSIEDPDSYLRLSQAIDLHQDWLARSGNTAVIRRRRRVHHAANLLRRRVAEVADTLDNAKADLSLEQIYKMLVEGLMASTLE
jgi:LAO/AO transport system kinase